jgi:hypothetical protein
VGGDLERDARCRIALKSGSTHRSPTLFAQTTPGDELIYQWAQGASREENPKYSLSEIGMYCVRIGCFGIAPLKLADLIEPTPLSLPETAKCFS